MHLPRRVVPVRSGRSLWFRRLRSVASSLLVAALCAGGGAARAATTGTTALLMPQGTIAESQDGDFISSSVASTCGGCTATPLNTIYRYFIEVPAGLTHLRVQIFDADVGAGGAAEATAQRDRSRAGAFSTSAKYTLIRPDGTTAATQTCNATATAFCADNAWTSLLDITTGIQAGHWELDVDQSTAVNTAGTETDINAFGIRADDGAEPGTTELPVYYSAQNQIGQNLPATGSGTKSYTFYPYITSGCSFTENDFDYDLNNGNANQNVGSIGFTSRSTAFTKTFANTALSTNDAWKINTVNGFTTDADAIDYGIWQMTPAISNYTNANGLNGNYANIYLASFQSAGGTPANNSPTANTFRVYFGTNAGGTPVKPYMTQQVRYKSGPQPPAVGQTTKVQVTVAVVNPAAKAITFGGTASNIVTATIPTTNTTYGGGAAVSQGSVTAQPAVGGTGNVTWNPGTLAAGGTALLTYLVNVTPTAAGQRVAVTGTPAANGTTGKWVDETGSTTQTRATLTFGPLCDLGVTVGLVTPVVVSGVRAEPGERGGVLVEWDTTSEVGTLGFDVLRWEPREDRFVQVNRQPVPGLLQAPQGGHYRFLDRSARVSPSARYQLVEHVATAGGGERRSHGPFDLELAASPPDRHAARPLPESGFDRTARPPDRPAEKRSAAQAAVPSASSSWWTPGSRLAIGVRDPGFYFLSAQSIADQLHLSQKVVMGMIAARGFELTGRAGEIAWTPAGVSAGTGGSSGILFYGEAAGSIYTRDNIYWLRPGPGTPMGTGAGAPPLPATTVPGRFRDTSHAEQKNFAATVVATDPESDYWFWEAFVAGDPSSSIHSFSIDAPGVAYTPGGTFGGTARLRLNLQGASSTGMSGEHQAAIFFNGTQIGFAQWTGITSYSVDLDFDEGLVRESGNGVQLEAMLNPGVPYSYFYLQSLDLSYPRSYRAAGDVLHLYGNGNPSVTAGGFSGSPVVLDLSSPTRPALVPATLTAAPDGTWQATFTPAAPQTPYLAVAPLGWRQPVSLAARSPQPLGSALGADYLVLTTHDLLPAARELAAWRAGQGLKTLTIDVQDVYDAFSQGLVDPHAIHDFLATARNSWNPAPRYVVLAGQGSFDYRDYLGFGGNLVPPLMAATSYGLFSSDNRLANLVSPAGLPDVAIGRLPVGTNAELHALVQKIRLYESGAPGAWSGQALLVADNQPGAEDFAFPSEVLAGALPPGYQPSRIYLDAIPADQARQTLLSALQAGSGLLSYVGHGGLDRLSSGGLLLASDTPTLTNGARQPVVSALTCTINRYEIPGFTPLGVALVNQPAGGAAAVWAPSGISSDEPAKLLGQRFYLALARGQAAGGGRLGDAVLSALRDFTAITTLAAADAGSALSGPPNAAEMVSIYQLLGDPGLLVKAVPLPAGGSSAAIRE